MSLLKRPHTNKRTKLTVRRLIKPITAIWGLLAPSKKHRDASNARWEDAQNKAQAANKAKAEYKAVKKAFKADAKAKAKADRALKKIEKQKYNEAVKQRSKEILKGKSLAGKIWDVYTGGHKIQAEIEVGLERAGYE